MVWKAQLETISLDNLVYLLVAQSYPTLWPMEPARLLCPWNSPGKNTVVSSYSFLQGVFPTWGLNPGLLHCRQTLYSLSHQGSPWTTLHHSKGHTFREILPVPAALLRLSLDPLPSLVSLSGSNVTSSRIGLSLPVFLRGHSCSTLSFLCKIPGEKWQ